MKTRTGLWLLVCAWLACCALPAPAAAQTCPGPSYPPPAQVGPAGCVSGTTPLFTWIAPSGAVDYRLTVLDPAGDAPIDIYQPETSYRAPSGRLSPGVQYRWKVKARWATCETWSTPGEGIFFQVGCTPPPGAENLSYYHLDAVGSVRAVTSQTGAVVEQHDYLPFGEEWCGTGPCGPNAAGEPVRFTGKERDAETGLDYFGARYYRPRVGRFTAVDPVLNERAAAFAPQQWNRYAYGVNNPLRYVDPDGKQSFPVSALLATTLDPPSRLPNRIDTGIGVVEGVLMGVIPGLEITANSPDQAAGQIMGQALTLVGGLSILLRRGDGATVTRYMTKGEVDEALRTGNIPNYGRDGLPRPTHVTTDAPVNSAAEAAARYEIDPPTHRATVPRSRVEGLGPAPDGRPTTSGGGSQGATNSPIPVRPSEIKPLEQ